MRRKLKDLKNLDNHFEKANFFCQLLVLDKYMFLVDNVCTFMYWMVEDACKKRTALGSHHLQCR